MSLEKRSVTIAGHRTSIALESEFWVGLEAMAAARHVALPQLIRELDQGRAIPNLTSALRLAVLAWYRETEAKAKR